MPCVSVSDNVPMIMSSSKKMQIVDWISHHLDRKTFSELKFTDERKRRFQVPWVHKSNRRWNENSAAVFRAWAEYKGKEENFSFTRAKTNFRMAMKCQSTVKEVRHPKERGSRRRPSDDEMCVKVYEFIEPNDIARNKPKRAKVTSSSTGSECSSQGTSSLHSPSPLPSSSQYQEDIPTVCTENRFEIEPHQQEDSFSFDQEILAAFAVADAASGPFEIKDLLPPDGDFGRLPSCQELLARKPPAEEFSKPYCDNRYIPQYESIGDMEVPRSDNSSVTCSPGGSADDTFGDCSLYDYTTWPRDLETHCQVANFTDNALEEYCLSDIQTGELMWGPMGNVLEQLIIRSFG